MSQAIGSGDLQVISEYAKRVKVGGSSQQAQYLRETYNLTDNFVDIVYTKGLKRSQACIPVSKLNAGNFRQIDVPHHALQISSALMKVVRNTLSDEEKQQAPKAVSASKQQILDLSDEKEDDDIVVRLEKAQGKTRKYEFFRVPYYAYKPSR